jgi:hypothetical protein
MTHCGGKTRAGGKCERPAGWGTDHVGWGHCKLHGGCAPSGRKSAKRLMAVDAVTTYGLPREVDPHVALMEELARTAGHVAWLGALLRSGKLTADQNPTGRKKAVKLTQNTLGGEIPSVWLQLYSAERKHLESVAKTCIACGIAERQVQVAEQQANLFGEALRGILSDLGVADHPEVGPVVRRHLTLVAGAP